MNGHPALKTHSFEVRMAFSIEEAPCGSTGFFTTGLLIRPPGEDPSFPGRNVQVYSEVPDENTAKL